VANIHPLAAGVIDELGVFLVDGIIGEVNVLLF
jgi:hypothetical protein